jgi:hypothetical protein
MALTLAAAWAAAGCSLDFINSLDLGRYPVLSNIIAAVAFLPLEVLIVSVFVTRFLAGRERERWRPVTEAPTDSVSAKWREYREFLQARYQGFHTQHAKRKIDRAQAVWAPIHDLEVEADRTGSAVSWSDHPLPAEVNEILSDVQGVWMGMWGGSAEEQEEAFSNRITRILLPRLLPNDPGITHAVRDLSDAIEDLNDLRTDLSLWNDPFPDTPFADETTTIAYGAGINATMALDMLESLLRSAQDVVDAGDRLVALLSRE